MKNWYNFFFFFIIIIINLFITMITFIVVIFDYFPCRSRLLSKVESRPDEDILESPTILDLESLLPIPAIVTELPIVLLECLRPETRLCSLR